MRSFKLALLATGATALLSSAAFAADLIVDVPTEPTVIDNSFSFDGAYMGLFIQGQTAPTAFGIGADLGVNALLGGLVLGGEIEGVAAMGPNFSGQLTGKVGAVLGDAAMAYVYSGIGTRTPSSFYVPVGAGIEFAVADNLGLKAEAQYNFDLTTSAQDSAAVKVGLNWHF
jgi:opacity protein-like surface antigen